MQGKKYVKNIEICGEISASLNKDYTVSQKLILYENINLLAKMIISSKNT